MWAHALTSVLVGKHVGTRKNAALVTIVHFYWMEILAQPTAVRHATKRRDKRVRSRLYMTSHMVAPIEQDLIDAVLQATVADRARSARLAQVLGSQLRLLAVTMNVQKVTLIGLVARTAIAAQADMHMQLGGEELLIVPKVIMRIVGRCQAVVCPVIAVFP
eukprot:gnl/MRDRNA2_/MRDRNA2_78005_c0_seq1.p2 gnl/MRDRNA2_/MRDRNA2_78005_c0~~gnl/MRDRNA2_/MRDRNA2_78005_c0_seq1.p2  ORF type:complete len:161 (+),score=5.12 gnl/MRDRNA2_/MRDRNA2_78005_c0_seq1:548-1030(+)